jgi:hypothetical protein
MDDIATVIGRVRRAMPRNSDVMAVCDAAERVAATASPVTATAPIDVAATAARVAATACPICAQRRERQRFRMQSYRRRKPA